MQLSILLTVMALGGVSACRVLAGFAPNLVEVPIDQEAISGPGGDPVLFGFRTFDLHVEVPPGYSFNVAGVSLQLTQGVMYAPQRGSDLLPDPADVVEFPYLEYDTYISAPQYVPGAGTIVTPSRFIGLGAPDFPRINQQRTS